MEEGRELRALCARQFRLADQFLKERPVVNHCLAQLFGTGLPPRLAKRYFMAGSVILHDLWMIHGDIRCTLFKITYRIAARGHHVAQQLIGIRNGASRAVNEPRLDPLPGLYEARTIARCEGSDVETFDSFSALVELGFRMPLAPAFLHGAGILRSPKTSA